MATLKSRLEALEAPPEREGKPVPLVVADDTSDDDLERLRRGVQEVYRWSDAVELFICPSSLMRRVEAIEQRHRDSPPQLPALVVVGENSLVTKRAEFIATHDKPPEIELVIKRTCARLVSS